MNIFKPIIKLKVVLILLFLFIITLNAQNSSLVITPSPAYLGKIPLTSSQEQEFSLLNVTSSTVTITGIAITGNDAAKFILAQNPAPYELAGYSELILDLIYTPTVAGEDVASIELQTSAGAIVLNLSAYGTELSGTLPTFERLIGLKEEVEAFSVKQTVDDGFVLVGNTMLEFYVNSDVYLVKTDIYGKEEWSRVFEAGAFGESYDGGDDQGYDVLALSDGSIIVLALTDSDGPGSFSVFLSKWDADGNFIWENTYGGIYDDIGYRIIEDTQGNFLLTGSTNNTPDDSRNTLVMKIAPDGSLIWNKNYGTPGIESGFDILQSNDGGYLIVGNSQNPTANIYFVKLDVDGNEQWSNTLTSNIISEGSRIEQANDGGYIVSGYTITQDKAREAYIVKVNASGELQWSKSFGSLYIDYFSAVTQTADNGYLCVGAINQFFSIERSYDDIYMVKTDSEGNLIWEKRLGGELNDYALDMIGTRQGGYVIAGATSSYTSQDKLNLFVVTANGEIADGSITGVERDDDLNIPHSFSLSQNYPNPFNPSTIIEFDISPSTDNFVQLKVYDLLGNEIATLVNGDLAPGHYRVDFNSSNLTNKKLSSGIYFYSLINGKSAITKKMMLLK